MTLPLPETKQDKSGRPLSVLIVDDHPAMRTTMLDILREEGFLVMTAELGEEAVRLCMEHSFDIVLMDVQMPEMTGVEAFRQIRKNNHHTPHFIFMSAYSVGELKEECYRLGAVAFLQKPLDMDEVIHLIRDRNSPSVLIFMKDAKAQAISCKALLHAGFRVVSVDTFDEVLINARQISHRFVVVESKSTNLQEIDLKAMLAQVSPFSQLLEARSEDDPTLLLEKLSRLRLQPVRQDISSSGW